MKTTAALLVVTSMTAQAAEPVTLTLACEGTVTDISQPVDGKPEPTSMGIIVNFTARTVAGLDFPLKITKLWSSSRVATTLNEPSGAFPAESTA
jgi:hypothetical protein